MTTLEEESIIIHSSENLVLLENIDPALIWVVVSVHTTEENFIPVFAIHRQRAFEVSTYLKLSALYKAAVPVDCYAIDNVENKFRFTVVYTIRRSFSNDLIRFITKTNDSLPLISTQSIYPSFNWAEREIWDLMGIFFIKHPDLRRILTYYGFAGHPLRKYFPLSGFREVHYEDTTKHIEYDSLELAQNYRVTNLINPWSNE